MREDLSVFSRFIQHATLSFDNDLPPIRKINRFITREISSLNDSITYGESYSTAYELYLNDRRIFYDKIKTILSKMNSNCNYTQNLSKCNPKNIVEKSWFLQEYLHTKCESKPQRQSLENQLIAFFTLTETETRKSGVLTNDFSTNSLTLLKSSICGKYIEQSIDYYLFEKNNDNNDMPLFELLNSLIAFSKQYTSCNNETIVNGRSNFEDELLDYDDEKITYKKKDDLHFDSISEPFFEKFCVTPYDYADESLDDMPLSSNTLSCLRRGKITNLCDILLSSPQRLSKIYQFGPGCLDDLMSYLNMRFGEPQNNRALKSQLRCRQSVDLRRLHPYTKQMAVSHLKNLANGVQDVCEFGMETQNSVQQIFEVLGGDMCRLLTNDYESAIYISAFIEDALEIENRKIVLNNLISSLPQTTLAFPFKPLMWLCDSSHGTRLKDIIECSAFQTISDIDVIPNMQLRRKEFCDTKFFLKWISDGAKGIARKILDKLFAKHYARLEIFTCLAEGNSNKECAVKNDVTCETIAVVESQILRQYTKLPECTEIVLYANALLNNVGKVTKQQFLDIVNVEESPVIFYLASKVQNNFYVYDSKSETFYIKNV